MSSVSSRLLSALALAAGVLPGLAAAEALRVCADPNNLPFSNAKGQGFENAIAELLADDFDMEVAYTWWPQRRGFARQTLNAGRCDLIVGAPAGYELAATTRPYYRSSYVFVSRKGRFPRLDSLDDPRLAKLRIGVHVIGDDYTNVPPAHALAMRGLAANLRGYSIYGDYSEPDPPRALIDAVANGEIDVAVAWGPTAGYFARHSRVPLDVQVLAPGQDAPGVRMRFAIAMAVRRDDAALRARLDEALERRGADVQAILARYGVPVVAEPAVASAARVEDD